MTMNKIDKFTHVKKDSLKKEKDENINKTDIDKSIQNGCVEVVPKTEVISEIPENAVKIKSEKYIDCGIVANLPKDLPNTELVNYLSKRGVPISNIKVNHDKYAMIEVSGDFDAKDIQDKLKEHEMIKESNVVQISGNYDRLNSYITKHQESISTIIIRNISKKIEAESILQLIPNYPSLVRSSSCVPVLCTSGKTKKEMTLEVLSTDSEEIMNKLNENQSKLGTKKKIVVEIQSPNVELKTFNNPISDDTPTNIIKIVNLPIETTLEHINELNIGYNKCYVSRKGNRNIGMMIFDTNEEASSAFNELNGKTFMGVELQLRNCYKREGREDKIANPCILHLTNLPYSTKKADIEDEFESVEIIHFPVNDTGKSKGFCYITFENAEAAKLAKDLCVNKIIGGRPIRCKFASITMKDPIKSEKDWDKGNEKRIKKNGRNIQKKAISAITLFNLPKGVTENQITEKLSGVTMVNLVMKDEEFKGIAEVHFATAEQAAEAIKRTDIVIGGRKIRKELKGGSWRSYHKLKEFRKNRKSSD